MTQISVLGVSLIIAGFLVGALISEYSLRGVDSATQGYLMKSLAPLRRMHLVGLPVTLILSWLFPSLGWWLLFAYLGLAVSLATVKLWRMDLPARLRNWQVASASSVLLGAGLATIATYAIQYAI